jgi:nicotinate-nucleotide adenylyltransferase
VNRRKVGIMGGTFDPIHIGHLLAAERAREALALDEVRFMPTFQPPHKSLKQGATPEQRRAMVELAIADHSSFRVETMELDRGGVSYAADTAVALTEREPTSDFYWIIGADMVLYLPKWHRIEEVVRHVTFLGLTRPGFPIDPAALPLFLRKNVRFAEMPALDISSTLIRERCLNGLSIRYVVPERVERFIAEKGLYTHADVD